MAASAIPNPDVEDLTVAPANRRLALPEPHVSASRIGLYQACPRQEAEYYRRGRVRTDGDPARLGRVFHAIVAKYLQDLFDRAESSNPDLIPAITQLMLDIGEDILPPADQTDLRLMLDRFARSWRLPSDALAYIEQLSVLSLAPDLPPLVSFLDLLLIWPEQWYAEVWDWKSGRVMLESWEVERNDQMRLYALQTAVAHPEVETIKVTLYYPRTDSPQSSEFTRDEALDFQAEYATFVRRMLADQEGRPRAGHHCKWCMLAQDCPAGKGLPAPITTPADARRAVGLLRSAADAVVAAKQRLVALREAATDPLAAAQELANRLDEAMGDLSGYLDADCLERTRLVSGLSVLERAAADLKAMLRRGLAYQEGVTVDHYVYGPDTVLREEIPDKKTAEYLKVLQANGIEDVSPYVHASGSQLKKLPPSAREAVSGLVKQSGYSKLDWRKVGEPSVSD